MKPEIGSKKVFLEKFGDSHLSVRVHHRPEQLPRSPPPVHPDHPEDLEEPQPAEGGGREHLAVRAGQDDDGGNDGDYVWKRKKGE